MFFIWNIIFDMIWYFWKRQYLFQYDTKWQITVSLISYTKDSFKEALIIVNSSIFVNVQCHHQTRLIYSQLRLIFLGFFGKGFIFFVCRVGQGLQTITFSLPTWVRFCCWLSWGWVGLWQSDDHNFFFTFLIVVSK